MNERIDRLLDSITTAVTEIRHHPGNTDTAENTLDRVSTELWDEVENLRFIKDRERQS